MKQPNEFKIRASKCSAIMAAGRGDAISVGAKTYCHDWLTGSKWELNTKEILKGRDEMTELRTINMASQYFNLDFNKNKQKLEDLHLTGEADVVHDEFILDVKSSWSFNSLCNNATSPLSEAYRAQMQVYMELYNKPKAYVFHGLVNTPAFLNNGEEIEWEDTIPFEKRFVVFEVLRDKDYITKVRGRVEQCREYLANYIETLNTTLGSINQSIKGE